MSHVKLFNELRKSTVFILLSDITIESTSLVFHSSTPSLPVTGTYSLYQGNMKIKIVLYLLIPYTYHVIIALNRENCRPLKNKCLIFDFYISL